MYLSISNTYFAIAYLEMGVDFVRIEIYSVDIRIFCTVFIFIAFKIQVPMLTLP